MSELKKKLDRARPHCLPRALVLINPGNPTGTLNVYRFVITCSNINADDDDDSNDNRISRFTLDILLAHRLLRSSFLFKEGTLIKGCSLYQGVGHIGVLFFLFYEFPPNNGMFII